MVSESVVGSFAGPVTKVAGRVHAGPDEILVVLRNGRPERVVEPGRRVMRGLGAPITGALDVIQVNATTMTMRLPVKNVSTGEIERYIAPSVTVEFTVRLGDASSGRPDYSGFADLVHKEGTRFGEVLVQRMQTGVERLVRERFRASTHDTLHHLPDSALEQTVPFVIEGGLMTVTSARIGDVTWDPQYEQARRHEGERTEASLRAARDASAILDRIREMDSVSRQTGIPVLELVFPERHAAALEREHELRKTVLSNPALAARVTRDPVLGQVLGLTDQVVPAHRAARAASPPTTIVSTVAQGFGALPAAPGFGGPADASIPPGDFTLDQRHRRAWLAGRGSVDGLVGLAGAATSGRAVVVAVGRQDRPLVGDEVVARLAALHQGAPVTVLALQGGTGTEVARDWFAVVCAELPGSVELTVRTEVDDADRLWINVSGPVPAVRTAVKHANAPDRPELAALTAVLPYSDVCVQQDAGA